MPWRSIGARLTAWYTGVLATILLLTAIGVWAGLRRSVNATVDRELQSRLTAVRTYIKEGPDDSNIRDHWVHELSEDSMVAPGKGVMVVSEAGRSLYRSPDALNWPFASVLSTRRRPGPFTAIVEGRRYRVLVASLPIGSVELALPLRAYDDVIEDFFATAVVASPVLLISAALAGMWLSRRALRPVDAITQAAQRVSASTLDSRLPVPASQDELRRLSETLNAMLERLEAEDRKGRQFTADASHELRTPVAIIRATADVTLSRPRTDAEHRQAWLVARAQTARLGKMVDAMLQLARSDVRGRSVASETLDLADEVREVCQEMVVVATRAGLALDQSIPSTVRFRGDGEGLRTLVSALLDNAVKYTPSGGRIDVSLEQTMGEAGPIVLRVSDTGIGLPADEVEHVFDRFYRVAKDRSRETGGAGLGLAIVRAIARQHGGDAVMASLPGRGSTVTVTFLSNAV
ncbi:MAG: ATP-binding protein [Acidobacteriota bacterium]